MDPRRIPGALTEAKDTHVMSDSEAGRRFGGPKASENYLVCRQRGSQQQNPETCRTQTRITADFDLALGVTKQKTLHIESVRVPPVNWAGSCTALSCRSLHQQQQN